MVKGDIVLYKLGNGTEYLGVICKAIGPHQRACLDVIFRKTDEGDWRIVDGLPCYRHYAAYDALTVLEEA